LRNQGGTQITRMCRTRTGRNILVVLSSIKSREACHSTENWGSVCIWTRRRRSIAISNLWRRPDRHPGTSNIFFLYEKPIHLYTDLSLLLSFRVFPLPFLLHYWAIYP
jgi:hypothetical protein